MSRLKEVILGNKGYNNANVGPMVDVREGGQNGPSTDFRSYVSNSSYVKRNIIAVLIEAPRGFQDLQDSSYWVETLKALVELHAKSIEGLQSTLSIEHVENAVGGAGEMQQDISNVTRARSTPTFTWNEKYGKPVAAFLNGWTVNLIMDPITKYPAVVSNGTVQIQDLLPDYTAMTVLFFEPDPTHTKVVEAWLCTNMRPNGTVAEITGRRDLTAGGESQDYSVEFTALTQVGAGVNTFAQQTLDNMTKTGLNPNQSKAFIEKIDAEVDTDANGYVNNLQDLANNTVD
jgi:hypothetical protein